MSKQSGEFRFLKHDSVGANDAEDDERFLSKCFEDTGDAQVLLDLQSPARIILGRTGAGKTALALQLAKRSSHVIFLNPEHLSLNFIANSTVIQYLTALGINLDPFFKLLWRHVFAVTIIQDRFDITDEQKQKGFFSQLKEYFESHEKRSERQRHAEQRQKALDYMRKWGDKFFQDVEHRTKEVATRFETEVVETVQREAGLDLKLELQALSGGASIKSERGGTTTDKLGIEKKDEIISRAKHVINGIQVRELGGIIELVDEILDDPQKPYYLVIDRLDEQWADETVRYRLLKGLIDTVKEFGRGVRHAKVLICLRIDLLEQLFQRSRTDAGFQEDKYRSLYLPIRWTREQLIRLLDKRIAELIRDRYTGYNPNHTDILPATMRTGRHPDKSATIDFILSRTWNRPRDVIEFFNACIRRSEGKPKFNRDVVSDAEGEYSRGRLRALAQEWHKDYPLLPECAKFFLTNRSSSFPLSEIEDSKIEEWTLAVACKSQAEHGKLWELSTSVVNNDTSSADFKRELASIFYRTGVVGLKTGTSNATRWSDNESYSVSPAELGESTALHIHPGLWRVLGVSG